MKTRTNKKDIIANRDHARALEEQARRLRAQTREMKEQLAAEENEILCDMIAAVREAGAFMTAREIVQVIGGTMSVHEVAGQLTWARNSKDSERKPQPYFGPAGCRMRHEAVATAAPLIEVEERKVTRCFAEVDESGKLIPGGRKFQQTESRNIYMVSK